MVAALKLPESRTYNRQDCITFRKTAERFGGLSNMAGGYPLFVNGVNAPRGLTTLRLRACWP